MALSNDPKFWQGDDFAQFREVGFVYVVVPARQLFSGPISLAGFINHKLGHSIEPRLKAIEALRSDPNLLPTVR